MESRTLSLRWVAVVVALVIVLFAGQALATASAPAGGLAATGRVMGQTGFAYLGGLRTFAAAVLWNRLEPLFHGYYNGKEVSQLKEFLPTMRLVQALDPQFEQAYYNAAWIVARRGRIDDAIDIAHEGITNNPTSGILHANYVQILLMKDKKKNLEEAYKSAVIGVGPTARWATADDQYEGYAIFRTVFKLKGDAVMVGKINKVLEQLSAQGAQPGQEDSHTIPGGN
jgi:tetratricopeptide (TPR) repeat protein